MINSETVRFSSDARGVATITLNRPEKHNALNAEMIRTLQETITATDVDPNIRVVVLTGAGESFCAGADLDWMRTQMAASRAQRMEEAEALANMLETLNALSKPVIARINGATYGGGIGLVSVCDVSIASESARFALTETKLGLIPATISPYVYARLGEARMRQIALSGTVIKGDEATKIGLVSKIVQQDQLDQQVEQQIGLFLQCAPGAIAETKSLIRDLTDNAKIDTMAMTISRLANQWETNEAAEGLQAFFDRTKPSWSSTERD
jgi:methylglutaconyl-CoA hydratase